MFSIKNVKKDAMDSIIDLSIVGFIVASIGVAAVGTMINVSTDNCSVTQIALWGVVIIMFFLAIVLLFVRVARGKEQ
jgi:hypothetical protein